MTDINLPWKATGLDGYSTQSGYTFDGGNLTGGGPWLGLNLTVRMNCRYGEPATVQLDVSDKRNGASVSLTPDLARQAAAALLAAADAADADMQHWRDMLDRQRAEMQAFQQRDLIGRAGLDVISEVPPPRPAPPDIPPDFED